MHEQGANQHEQPNHHSHAHTSTGPTPPNEPHPACLKASEHMEALGGIVPASLGMIDHQKGRKYYPCHANQGHDGDPHAFGNHGCEHHVNPHTLASCPCRELGECPHPPGRVSCPCQPHLVGRRPPMTSMDGHPTSQETACMGGRG